MAEKVEDLNLPVQTVFKIIKDAISENINVGKDARAALSSAASIFVLYVTSQATRMAQQANRKVLLGQDIIKALEELEFDEFVEPLQELLKEFKETKMQKKANKAQKKEEKDGAANDETMEESGEEEEPIEEEESKNN